MKTEFRPNSWFTGPYEAPESVFEAGLAIRPDILLQRAGSQVFSLKLIPMDAVDAEGLDFDQVGEDRTCGIEQ